MANPCARDDLVGNRTTWWLLWGAPMAGIALGVCVGPGLRAALWTPAFLVMGGACVYNARHCGRLHCYLTGPLFLAAGVATLLAGFDVIPIRLPWVGWGAALGTVLAFAVERLRGKYVAQNDPEPAGRHAA